MYKILQADKDTYITNKVIRNSRMTQSNVGDAGTLDLFKLYGASMSGTFPNTEISRILIHFDLDPLRDAILQGELDPNDSSFWCKMNLRDVYGGQPTPSNFQISVYPLSSSFEEGIGRDVSYYSDFHIANWLSSSYETSWYVSGCSLSCDAINPGDYITSSINLASTEKTQVFKTGTEDLLVDVTSLVSATLSGELPDSGFRISFKDVLEENLKTYFVKRFASRNAYDETKHPKLIVGFDDSITDDSQNLTFDTSCDLILYNTSGGELSNILSGSSLDPVTGSNCLLLKLSTEVSGGSYESIFTGSQYFLGSCPQTGIYKASVNLLSSDPIFTYKIQQSGSIRFTPVWTSLDNSVAYSTGSYLYAYPQSRSSSRSLKKYVVSVTGMMDSYISNSLSIVRVNIFDQTNPLLKVVKTPVETPGIVVKNVFYQIRDVATDEIVVPFDDVKNSTKVSSDSGGMFFILDTSNLITGRTYVIDIMIYQKGIKNYYNNVSPIFRVEKFTDQT